MRLRVETRVWRVECAALALAAVLVLVLVGVAQATTLHEEVDHEARAAEKVAAFSTIHRALAAHQSRTKGQPTTPEVSSWELIKAFNRLEFAKDGLVAKNDFVAFFGISPDYFDLIDKDHDGYLSVSEFLMALGRPSNVNPQPEPTPVPVPTPTPTTTVDATKPATLTSVNLRVVTNGKAHHSDKYQQFLSGADVVLRRGQAFTLDLYGPAHTAWEQIVFRMGELDEIKNVGAAGWDKLPVSAWGYKVVSVVADPESPKDLVASFVIWLPSTMAIGKYSISATSAQVGSLGLGKVIVLFNPWSKFDYVFMADSNLAEVYTLHTTGRLWRGDALEGGVDGLESILWDFHQFEVLNIILDVIAKLPKGDLSNPILVARGLSWLLNNYGYGNGVLEGNWDENTPKDGVPPWEWTGSRAIYEQWQKSNHQPVKYGQCWVFAAIMTTAARALGLPCRPITNFRSAHDVAPYDHIIVHDDGDSVWNFHVWNEVWLLRPDRQQAAQWNAFDATPQELSGGKAQTGPATMEDIRNFRDSGKYEVPFILSEVNSVVWRDRFEFGHGTAVSYLDYDGDDVGRLISTLSASCAAESGGLGSCREDLTLQYKTRKNPLVQPRFRELPPDSSVPHEHMFVTTFEPARPTMGADFAVSVRRNAVKVTAPTTVRIDMRAESIVYTGKVIGVITGVSHECVMTPNPDDEENTCGEHVEGHAWVLNVGERDYRGVLRRSNAISVSVNITKISTGDGAVGYAWDRQFSMSTPRVRLEVPDAVFVGRPFNLIMHLVNPLTIPLSKVKIWLDTPDVDRHALFPAVPSRAAVRLVTGDILLSAPGKQSISITLDTLELTDIHGEITFNAVYPPQPVPLPPLVAMASESASAAVEAPAVTSSRNAVLSL